MVASSSVAVVSHMEGGDRTLFVGEGGEGLAVARVSFLFAGGADLAVGLRRARSV